MIIQKDIEVAIIEVLSLNEQRALEAQVLFFETGKILNTHIRAEDWRGALIILTNERVIHRKIIYDEDEGAVSGEITSITYSLTTQSTQRGSSEHEPQQERKVA